MNTEFAWIILRDIPKEKVQIDTDNYQIEGGFRGFQQVIPGLHYVSVEVDEISKGFWTYLEPNQVLVKVFNHASQQFEDDEPENTTHYQKLALGGAMSQVLIAYNHNSWEIWEKLTNYINPGVFSLILDLDSSTQTVFDHSGDLSQQQTRFEQALFNTHGGDRSAFLSEFQFCFIRWYTNNNDTGALNHWCYLLQNIYNAGESGILKVPTLFSNLIDILLVQFDCLSDDMFTHHSVIIAQAKYLAEDMIDSDIENIVQKGKDFEAYLQERGVFHD